MKSPHGFVWLPVLLGILAVLVVSGGAYWYVHQTSAPQIPIYQEATTTPSTQTPKETAPTTGQTPMITITNITGRMVAVRYEGLANTEEGPTPPSSLWVQNEGLSKPTLEIVMDGAASGNITFTLPANAPEGNYSITPVGIPTKPYVGGVGPGYMAYGKTNALVSATFYLSSSGTISESVPVPGVSTYTNTQYGFTLQYPSGVQINTTSTSQQSYSANINNGAVVATLGQITKTFNATEPGWGDNGVVSTFGKLVISVSTDPTDVRNCMTAPQAFEVGPSNIQTKQINRVNFLSYQIDEPATGLFSTDQTYTTLRGGVCYSIDEHIDGGASGHMNATDAAANNAVFAQLSAQLDEIARSFKFTTVSNNTQFVSSVAGMSQYTDADFGFSFWYPSGWKVVGDYDVRDVSTFPGGEIMNTLSVGDSPSDTIKIYEVSQVSGSQGVRIPGHLDSPTYYFDANAHTWMTYSSNYPNPQAANVSTNTMGGLHMLWTGAVFNPTVIPLSAHNFLVIGDPQAGIGRTDAFAKTLVATDGSVATPVSVAQQQATIQAERDAYAGQ